MTSYDLADHRRHQQTISKIMKNYQQTREGSIFWDALMLALAGESLFFIVFIGHICLRATSIFICEMQETIRNPTESTEGVFFQERPFLST